MSSFVLIFVCIAVGVLLKKFDLVPHHAHKSVNAWIIYVALPAVSLKYIPTLVWSNEMLLPMLGPIIVFTLAFVLIKLVSLKFRISQPTLGGLYICAGLCNTSFVGFPLITAYYGEAPISIAVICDQVTFVLLSTVGLMVAIKHSQKHQLSAQLVLKKMISFPPLWGCVLAFVLPIWFDLSVANEVLNKLAVTIAPLALFSIGLQLNLKGWASELRYVLPIIGYKLILAPAVVFLVAKALAVKGMITNITVFEAAMPTLLTASVIADEFELSAKLVNIIIGVSILLSLVTTAFWYFVLG